jgi:hypothetical protein
MVLGALWQQWAVGGRRVTERRMAWMAEVAQIEVRFAPARVCDRMALAKWVRSVK